MNNKISLFVEFIIIFHIYLIILINIYFRDFVLFEEKINDFSYSLKSLIKIFFKGILWIFISKTVATVYFIPLVF